MSTRYDANDEQKFYDEAEWGVFQSYHRAVLADLLAVLPDDARTILDVGCGDGLLTNELPGDRDVVGLDLSPEALKTVKRRAMQGSALDLPFENGSFDLVMANDVIEHFAPEHRAIALAEMERVASRYIIITTPFTEKLMSGYRTERRGRSHVNRHFDSFDVATMEGLFGTFQMTNCIFSGDEWEDELAPITYLKRAQTRIAQDRAPLDGAGLALDAALEAMRRRQAAYLTAYPKAVDQLRRRTEIMAIYERKSAVASHGRLDGKAIAWDDAVRTGRQRDLLDIPGGKLQLLQLPILPLTSRLPYIVSSREFAQEADRAVFAGEGILDLKFGFYAQVESGARLTLSLALGQKTVVSVNAFDPERSYVNLFRQELEAGPHQLDIALEKPCISPYGYLYQLVAGEGPVEIVQLRVEQDQRPSRIEIEAGPDYISRIKDNCTYYTGLEKTGRLLPLWFETAEAFEPTPEDLLETSGGVESLVIELALMRSRETALQFGVSNNLSHPGRISELERRLDILARQRTDDLAITAERWAETGSQIEGLRADAAAQAEALRSQVAILSAETADLRLQVAALQKSNVLLLLKKSAWHARRLTGLALARLRSAFAASSTSVRVAVSQKGMTTENGLPLRVTMLVPDDRIDRRVLLEARTIAARGARVVVVAVPYPEAVDLDQQQFPELKIVRIDTSKAASVEWDLNRGRLKDLGFDWKQVYFYTHQFMEAALAQPADLVVAHDLPVLPAAIAAADILGARLLYDAHELYPEQLHFGQERIELYRAVEKALIPLPDTVITVNKSIAEEMVKRYGIREPGVVLNAPNAAGMTVPVPRSTHLRDAFSIDGSKRILLFQGSLSLNRNLEPLVEAMAYVRSENVVLVVMGPGQAKREELEGIARQHNLLGSSVFFHDAVPQNELLAYTSGADFGIIPYPAVDINTTLCTPNKLFEFFVAGIPILANDLPELRRFVLGNGAGITHPMTSARDIAEAIDAILKTDLGVFRQAVERAAPSMTWQAQEPMVVAAYISAIRDEGPAAVSGT